MASIFPWRRWGLGVFWRGEGGGGGRLGWVTKYPTAWGSEREKSPGPSKGRGARGQDRAGQGRARGKTVCKVPTSSKAAQRY